MHRSRNSHRPSFSNWTRRFCLVGLFTALAGPAAPGSGAADMAALERPEQPLGLCATSGGEFLSVAEALALCFPGASFESTTVYLSDEQRERVEQLSGESLDRGIARPYLATSAEGQPLGFGWIDTHRVRSKKETLLIAADPEGRLLRVEVLAFGEPKDYLPRGPFYQQFVGRRLDGELDFGRALTPVAGATLSARGTLSATRRSLAVQAVLFPAPAPKPEPQPEPVPEPQPQPQPQPVPANGPDAAGARR